MAEIAETAQTLYEEYLAALRSGLPAVGLGYAWEPLHALLPPLSRGEGGNGEGSMEPTVNRKESFPASLPVHLQQIDTLKGWLDSFRPFPPAVVRALKPLYDVRWTYHSNAIEGNTLSQSETEMVLVQGITVGGKTLVEHLEVVGHKDAIDYVEELARSETPLGRTPLGEWEIKSLHGLLLRGVEGVTGGSEAGRYRTLDVRAAGTEHVYPPHYRLPELMEEFVRWLGSEEASVLHPVERAAQVHYRFVSIHPFLDGNGRVGRLLMNLFLLRAGYPIAVITNERRKAYIDALITAQSSAGSSVPNFEKANTSELTLLVAEACRSSLVEHLQVLSTAEASRGRGLPFYQEMVAFLRAQQGRAADSEAGSNPASRDST